MAGFDHQVLTNDGWDALADALNAHKLTFTHMAAGDGTVTGDVEMQGLSALKNWVMDFPITSYSDDGKGQVTLIGTLASKNVDAGFAFRECGVYATIDDGAQLLFSVSNAYEQADFIPSKTDAAIVVQSVQVVVKIDRAPNYVVNVVVGGDVTAANIGPATVGPGPFRDKVGQTIWLKRLRSPLGTLQMADTGDTMDIDIKTLAVSLDLYVANANPDIAPNFSTIQKALDYLMQYNIPSNITATVHLAAETFNVPAQINCMHPQASQIRIIGAAARSTTVSAVTNQDASNFRVTVASTTGLVVGQQVLLLGPAIQWRGSRRVNAIAGNVVTLEKAFRGGIDYTTGQTGSFVLMWFPSIVRLVSSSHGFYFAHGIGYMGLMTLSGNGASTSIYQVGILTGANTCYFDQMIICNCFEAIESAAGTLTTGNYFSVNTNVHGVNLIRAVWYTNGEFYINGNWYMGVEMMGAMITSGPRERFSASFAGFFIANQWGIGAGTNSAVSVNLTYLYMNGYGIYISGNSVASLGNVGSGYPVVSYTNSYDLYAGSGGQIHGSLAGGTAVSYSPPMRTVGNDQGYISLY